MSGGTGDALRAAYASPCNSARALLELTHPHADVRGLRADGFGLILDPRPEHAEQSPSFNTWPGEQDGAAMFQRKGTGETWNAVQWLEQYGKGGQGMTRQDAAALLIARAGMVDTPRAPSGIRVGSPSLGTRLRARQGQNYAENPGAALSGWEPLTPEQGAEVEPGSAWRALEARGLLPALSLGMLEAYRRNPQKPGRVSGLITSDALALKVRGPDSPEPLAVKFRNDGTAEELKVRGQDRYVYPKGHKGTPAHCSPGLVSPDVSAEVWTEGELNGVAFMLGAHAAGLSGVGVQGMAGAGGNPHVRHTLTGRRVYVYADGDAAGDAARLRWAQLASELGAVPYMLPQLPEGMDAADFLGSKWGSGTREGVSGGADALGAWLAEHLDTLEPWEDPEPPAPAVETFGEGFTSWPYGVRSGEVVKLKRSAEAQNGEDVRPLLGFTARITAEVTRDSGDGNPLRVFQVEGHTPEGRPLPPIEVPTGKFNGMSWPLELWGADGFTYPGTATRDESRAALLRLSKAAGMEQRTVHTRTGWADIPGHGMVFLTAGACVGADGTVPGVGVSLLGKLKHYALPDPPEGHAEAEGVRRALELLELGPAPVMVPLMGAVFRAPLGNVRLSVWLECRTGWGKSTLARVLQAFYGAGWVEHFPPADFQSTDNALTLGAFLARDVPFVADDFKPEGTRSAIDAEHAKLSRFLSSAGNGSGRDRMTSDALTVRTGYYPRGLVIATAETSPRKHSDVARTVVVTMPGPLFGPGGPVGGSERFETAKKHAEAGVYAGVTSGYLRWVARRYGEVTGSALAARVQGAARDFPGAHGRTSHNAAELLEGWRAFLTYARDCGALSDADALALGERAADALRNTADVQGAALEGADPVSRFLPLLSGLLRSGAVHLRDAETGTAPGAELGAGAPDAPAAGWHWRPFGDPAKGDGVWATRPGSVPVGFLGEYGEQKWALLEADVYAQVNRAAEGEGYGLPAPRSLWQGLRERHAPSGEMDTEAGKATYRRRVYGCGPGERIPLYNIVWPLPLKQRDERDTSQKTPISTGNSGVPFYILDKGHFSRKGTPPIYPTSDTAFSGVPLLPSAEDAEQHAEYDAYADALEVFTV